MLGFISGYFLGVASGILYTNAIYDKTMLDFADASKQKYDTAAAKLQQQLNIIKKHVKKEKEDDKAPEKDEDGVIETVVEVEPVKEG